MESIRILSPDLTPLREIDNYLSFTLTKSYCKPGSFTLVLEFYDALELQKNNLLMLGKNKEKIGIIRHREFNEEQTKLTVTGFLLGDITSQRRTIPQEGKAEDEIEADAETVIKHYVQRNCIDIESMRFPNLVIAENKHRGKKIKWKSRYKKLSDELEKISKETNIGWHIYIDAKTSKWIFDVYEGEDKSSIQSERPPVIFSSKFDNLENQILIDSNLNYFNAAIIAGQGEGADREIVIIEDDKIGIEKYVTFIDARDLKTKDELKERGQNKLDNDFKELFSFDAKLNNDGSFQYERDWNVGDIVTIQNKNWNVTKHVRVTQVEEVYEDTFKINITFGDVLPTLAEKIKSTITNATT